YEVIVTLDPTKRVLYPDLSVTVEIVAERRPNTLAVPLLAVVMRDPEGLLATTSRERHKQKGDKAPAVLEGVFVLADGVARFKPVRSGIVGDQFVEIRRGLAAGERVIAGPYHLLRTLEAGMEVETDSLAVLDTMPDSTSRP
ncbi:MAG: hypothetical protein ABI969_13625, partial [bacterium]